MKKDLKKTNFMKMRNWTKDGMKVKKEHEERKNKWMAKMKNDSICVQ